MPRGRPRTHGLARARRLFGAGQLALALLSLAPAPGRATTRAFDAFLKCYERGLLTRTTGDVMALSPPLIIEKNQIDEIFGTIAEVVKTLE